MGKLFQKELVIERDVRVEQILKASLNQKTFSLLYLHTLKMMFEKKKEFCSMKRKQTIEME